MSRFEVDSAQVASASTAVRGSVGTINAEVDRMMTNLNSSGGVVNSEGVLLALVQAGLKRQEAYGLVQRAAMKYFNGEGPFMENLAADPEVAALLTREQIESCFSIEHHLRWVDAIFARKSEI